MSNSKKNECFFIVVAAFMLLKKLKRVFFVSLLFFNPLVF